jgi:ribosome-associated toxin RatA of RatAB toxin-antitoxin module
MVPAAAHAAALDLAVRRIEQSGQSMYEIEVSGVVRAPPATVWKVLTSYDRMSEYLPDLSSCKVLSRNGNEIIVEQYGTGHFLFLQKAIHLVVRITETPMAAIDVGLVSGDMKHYTSRWELQPVAATGGTQIRYSGSMMPDFYLPAMLGASMIRSDINRMLEAVLARIDSVYEQEGGAPLQAR